MDSLSHTKFGAQASIILLAIVIFFASAQNTIYLLGKVLDSLSAHLQRFDLIEQMLSNKDSIIFCIVTGERPKDGLNNSLPVAVVSR